MLKILGRKTSSNVQKVLWCCAELGIPFTREDRGGPFGGTREPDYLRLNPNGLVPTVIDGDLVLWESNSVVRYLDIRYGGGVLLPTEPGPRALAERWMDWTLSTATRPMATVLWQVIRTSEAERDHAALAAAVEAWTQAMTILDGHLAENAYTGGEAFGAGDICLGSIVYRWFALPIDRPDLPHLAAWYGRLAERPAFAEHVVIPLE